MDVNACLYWIVPGFSQTLECIGRILAGSEVGRKVTDFLKRAKACSNLASMSIALLRSHMRLLTHVKLLASANICSKRQGIAVGKYSSCKQAW